jgi:tricorn protease interacting factor F2/3
MTAVSNMPAVSEKITGERKKVVFDETPLMSTYLLYIGAGSFDFIEEKRGSRTLRLYGVNGNSRLGTFALQFAADTLEFFEKYSGVPYPLPKLDLLAIPDFAAGAMENWGAVTFREVLLYTDEKTTSLAAKKRITEVIAHELWHQWSGNLVTMKWWDDLWLNEAFATYIAFKAVDHFFPHWDIWDEFLAGDTKAAFDMDQLSSTHPIAVTVSTPNEIEEIFDHISYGKGASVLRMIEHYIGEEPFRKGVEAYLNKFAYGNASADDLWNTLEQNSGQPVKDLLHQWITQPGFPLISVSRKKSRLKLVQKRFCPRRSADDSLWDVPLTWNENGQYKSLLLHGRDMVLRSSSSPVKLNFGQTGFYRTIYSDELYETVSRQFAEGLLSIHDRWGIINDLWAAVVAGYASLETMLSVLEDYREEHSSFVLEEINAVCSGIGHQLRLPSRGAALFRRFAAPFLSALDKVGWDGGEETKPEKIPEIKRLRRVALAYLLRAGDEAVIREARRRGEAYLDGEPIDPDIRGVVLYALALQGEAAYFDVIRKKYEASQAIEEKLSLLGALADFKDESLFIAYLDYSLTEAVRQQDLRIIFTRVVHNPLCAGHFFDWVHDRWERLSPLHTSHFVFRGLLQTLILSALDNKVLAEITEFLKPRVADYEQTRANAVETAGLHIALRERNASSALMI